jgi:hypothetical protein
VSLNTEPSAYAFDLFADIKHAPNRKATPSQIVQKVLLSRENVHSLGFNRALLRATIDDAIEEDRGEAYLRRLNKWVGARTKLRSASENIALLSEVKYYGSRIVPDAFLLCPSKKTVVCYEVEDRHALPARTLSNYLQLWFALEYLYWDLHLISYDTFGNPRIIEVLSTGMSALRLLGEDW